ncbi:MAG: universal stress protein [Bacteroidetes bacterium]|nr:universal stress protein [Bacteroidota bacterium]
MPIKKILCPTDFSNAANNAVEYAAYLAKKTGAQITLTHVLSLPVIYDDFNSPEMLTAFDANRIEVEQILKNQAANVRNEFEVACDYDLMLSNAEDADSDIAQSSEVFDLIVCGTNGADNIFQFYFGSHSYRISRNAAAATLIVPEVCTFKGISNMVFLSGYKAGDQIQIGQLQEFVSAFNANLTAMHVSEKDTPGNQELYHTFAHLLDEAFDFRMKINFHRMVNEDTAQATEHYMHESHADVLAVYMEKHGFLYRLFHTDLIKNITSYADYPVLVFHR